LEPLGPLCPERGLGAELTLSQNQLPKGTSHVALCRLDKTAALKAAVDLLDRDPSDLPERLFSQLYRSRHGRDDVRLTLASHRHYFLLTTPLSNTVIAPLARHRNSTAVDERSPPTRPLHAAEHTSTIHWPTHPRARSALAIAFWVRDVSVADYRFGDEALVPIPS
jgi:hypothetical protein